MRGTPLRAGLSSLAATLAVMVVPSVSSAAITIGPDVNQATSGSIGCSSGTEAGTCSNAALDGGALVTSPIDGVVVRWRAASSGAFSMIAPTFRILRNMGSFTGAGSSAPTPAFAGVGEFEARLPIRTGDRIGVDLPPILGPCAQNCIARISGGSLDSWRPVLADGESPGRSPTSSSASTVLVSADVEPDADQDGFGDETQDGCPATGGPAGGCPTTAPAPPGASLSGAKTQDALRQGAVVVLVTSDQAGGAAATGTIGVPGAKKSLPLFPASSNLAPGAETRLRLRLPAKVRKRVRRAWGKGKIPKARLSVVVTTDAGGSTTLARTVKIKATGRKKQP